MSVFELKTLNLRDGAKVFLRSPEEDDAEKLLAYLDVVRRETPFLMFGPEDDLPSVAWERNWIKERRDDRGGVQIMAFNAMGKVLGLCGIDVSRFDCSKHRGELGISVCAQWCGRGLGGALMDELIAWATAKPGLEVLMLSVMEENDRAIRVYERSGFVAGGRSRWSIRRGGKYVDEIIMSRWVGEGPEPPRTD